MQNIISYIGTGFLIISFIMTIRFFGIIGKAKDTFKAIRSAYTDLQNPNFEDHAKEIALRLHSKHLFLLFVQILFGSAVAVIFPFLVLWVCERFGALSLSSVITTAVSWQSVLVTTTATVLLLSRANLKHRSILKYSFLDKTLHRIAFLTKSSQIAVADFEEQLFAKRLKFLKHEKPVFVTALPRTGTTLILNICTKLNEFASNNYRDMPFIFVPMLWNKISSIFHRTEALQERAHGDGMLVGYDSPEAFEEMLWITFWKKHYLPDRIIPWDCESDSDIDIDFFDFFQKHMRKTVALRQNSNKKISRYISKNNNNIARLDFLIDKFPDAIILIPFRQPLQQAASLLHQHQNFLELHSRDGFACDYMKNIGHFDFGENLKPIDFKQWLKDIKLLYSRTLLFWIEYWIAVYSYINAKANENIFVLSYDELCYDPQKGLSRIADVLDIKDRITFLNQANLIRAPKSHKVNIEQIPQSVMDEASLIYFSLKEKSLI